MRAASAGGISLRANMQKYRALFSELGMQATAGAAHRVPHWHRGQHLLSQEQSRGSTGIPRAQLHVGDLSQDPPRGLHMPGRAPHCSPSSQRVSDKLYVTDDSHKNGHLAPPGPVPRTTHSTYHKAAGNDARHSSPARTRSPCVNQRDATTCTTWQRHPTQLQRHLNKAHLALPQQQLVCRPHEASAHWQLLIA